MCLYAIKENQKFLIQLARSFLVHNQIFGRGAIHYESNYTINLKVLKNCNYYYYYFHYCFIFIYLLISLFLTKTNSSKLNQGIPVSLSLFCLSSPFSQDIHYIPKKLNQWDNNDHQNLRPILFHLSLLRVKFDSEVLNLIYLILLI